MKAKENLNRSSIIYLEVGRVKLRKNTASFIV
jgi:hypothetical protein